MLGLKRYAPVAALAMALASCSGSEGAQDVTTSVMEGAGQGQSA